MPKEESKSPFPIPQPKPEYPKELCLRNPAAAKTFDTPSLETNDKPLSFLLSVLPNG
jgi:hypothetical protein